MIWRLSHKLKSKIKSAQLSELPLDENPYADWSSHLFTAARSQYIILTNTASLYSCVMAGRGISNQRLFVERALETIRDFTADDGQQFNFRKFVIPAATDVRFAKSLNRSVIGSMNELVEVAKIFLSEGMSVNDVGYRLNETPLSALTDAEGRKYAKPKESFIRLADRMNHE